MCCSERCHLPSAARKDRIQCSEARCPLGAHTASLCSPAFLPATLQRFRHVLMTYAVCANLAVVALSSSDFSFSCFLSPAPRWRCRCFSCVTVCNQFKATPYCRRHPRGEAAVTVPPRPRIALKRGILNVARHYSEGIMRQPALSYEPVHAPPYFSHSWLYFTAVFVHLMADLCKPSVRSVR